MSVMMRRGVEAAITKLVIQLLIDQSYKLSVHDGDDEGKITNDKQSLFEDCMGLDEAHLYVYPPSAVKKKGADAKAIGWVYLVYGNDGYDLISDYTTNLDDALKAAFTFAESFDATGDYKADRKLEERIGDALLKLA